MCLPFRKPKYRGKDSITEISSYALPPFYPLNPADLQSNIHAEIRLDQVCWIIQKIGFVSYTLVQVLITLTEIQEPKVKIKPIIPRLCDPSVSLVS